MLKHIKMLKNENRGSSLLIAIIAIAFIGILATVILTSSVTNYQLRVLDNQSQKSFYSAETALQEIYAGLGIVCYQELENSYTEVVEDLFDQVTTNGVVYYVQKDNEEANALMKEKYMAVMQSYFPSIEDAIIELTSYITYQNHAFVTKIGEISYDSSEERITLEDVVVQYQEDENDYYATVTVDMVIQYPQVVLDFTDGQDNSLETYQNYTLIGDQSIVFGYDDNQTLYPAIAEVSGGVYAGEEGIHITSGSVVELQDIIDHGEGQTNTTVVTSGDVSINGDMNPSILNIGAVDLWCNNINVGEIGSDNISILNYFTGYNSNTYVKDDLNINGNNSEVTLGDSYYGYGYQGTLEDAQYSSAIIVNGKNCVLNTVTLKNFLLAGRAYLDFSSDSGATSYMTADAIAIKGNQEIYLVPSNYMESSLEGVEATNPSQVSPTVDGSGLLINLSGFYAYDLGLLNGNNPYVVKEIDSKNYYCYLNFVNEEARETYVKTVIDQTYLSDLVGGALSSTYINDWNNLHAIITKSMDKFIASGAIGLTFQDSTSIYTSGTLYQVNNGTIDVLDTTNTSSTDEVLNLSLDKDIRYQILQAFLFDPEGEDLLITLPDSINIYGIDYTTANIDTVSIYERVVDSGKLSALSANYEEIEDTNLNAVITNQDGATSDGKYTIPDNITEGVVLGYNTDIYLNHDFEGLIITNQKIIISGNAIVTSGIRNKASQILDNNSEISQYFYSYNVELENTSGLEQITVNDILSFNNWRKNDGE